jgi:hypothetical protein
MSCDFLFDTDYHQSHLLRREKIRGMHLNAEGNDSYKGAQSVKNLIDERIHTRETQMRSEVEREFKTRFLRGIENLQARECSTLNPRDSECIKKRIQRYEAMVREASYAIEQVIFQLDSDNYPAEYSNLVNLELLDHCTRRIDETQQEVLLFASCFRDGSQDSYMKPQDSLQTRLEEFMNQRMNQLKCGVRNELNATASILKGLLTSRITNPEAMETHTRSKVLSLPESSEAKIVGDLLRQNAMLRKTLARVREVQTNPILHHELNRLETSYLKLIEELSSRIGSNQTSGSQTVDKEFICSVLKVVLEMNDHLSQTFVRALDLYVGMKGYPDKSMLRFIQSTASRCVYSGGRGKKQNERDIKSDKKIPS